MKKYLFQSQILTVLIVILCGAVFILDLAIPQGYAGGVAYLFPMLLSSYYPRFRAVAIIASICIILTILGFSLSSIEAVIELVLMNRVLAILVILSCAWFIKAQKKAEENQERIQAEFQTLWETSAEGMITVNSAGLITRMNSTVKTLFGYEQQELVGQAVEVLIPKDLRKSHSQFHTEYKNDPYKRSMGEGLELYGLSRDGTQFPLQISLSPIEIEGNQEVLVEIQDISKKIIIEDKLRQSEKLSAIGRLTGGLAHDLNNILTAMAGFTELTQHRLNSDDESFKDLEQVLNGANRAKELISKMLAFSSQQVLAAKLCNINDDIVEMQEMLQQLISSNTKLILNLNPKLHLSYLDHGQLGQVIVNIVVNASDAMPNGGSLTITTNNVELDENSLIDYQVDKPGHYTELTISDSGVGIHQTHLKNIFEPFYTTKGKDKGTGLGLATVYGIVKQSKGEIVVFSEPGTGTTIKMYFPVAESRIKVGEGFSKEPLNQSGQGNIVLVEDDEAVRILTKRILESNGYIVNDFESAEKTLEMIASIDRVGLVLTDIVMGGMSGVELGKKLKLKYPETTVMYMSGFTGDALEDVNERGDDSLFVSKPFTQKALLEKVKQHMQ